MLNKWEVWMVLTTVLLDLFSHCLRIGVWSANELDLVKTNLWRAKSKLVRGHREVSSRLKQDKHVVQSPHQAMQQGFPKSRLGYGVGICCKRVSIVVGTSWCQLEQVVKGSKWFKNVEGLRRALLCRRWSSSKRSRRGWSLEEQRQGPKRAAHRARTICFE